MIFSSEIVACLPFLEPFPGNSSKKRAKSKRLKHSTFSTCSIILFSSVKQLTLAFDDHDRNQKKWQQNQRNLHHFEITLKRNQNLITTWPGHFQACPFFRHLWRIPRGSALVGSESTPSNGLFVEAPTEKGALFTQFQVYERVEIS